MPNNASEQVVLEFRTRYADALKGIEMVQKATQQSVNNLNALLGRFDQSTSKLGTSINKVNNNLQKVVDNTAKSKAAHEDAAVSVNKHANSYNAFGTQVGQAIRQLAGVYASITAVKKVIGDGVEFNKFIESSTMSFEVMMKSAAGAKNLMEDLYNFAVKSPLTFRDTVAASRQLMAYGFQTKELVGTMGTLGTVAKAVGITLGDLSYVYGTLRSQGRAYTRDLMQFGMRGIPIYDELSKVMGVAVSDIQKLTAEGKVGFREVEQAFLNMTSSGGRFGGFLEKYMTTLEGKMAWLSDLLQKTAGTLSGGIFDAAKRSIGGFIAVLESPKFLDNIQRMGEGLGKAATNMMEFGMLVLENLPALLNMVKAFILFKAALWAIGKARVFMTFLAGLPAAMTAVTVSATASAASITGISGAMVSLKASLFIADLQIMATALWGVAKAAGAAGAAAGAAIAALAVTPAGMLAGAAALLGGTYAIGAGVANRQTTERGTGGVDLGEDQLAVLKKMQDSFAVIGMAEKERISQLQQITGAMFTQEQKAAALSDIAALQTQVVGDQLVAVKRMAVEYGLSEQDVLAILEAQKLITAEMRAQINLRAGQVAPTGTGARFEGFSDIAGNNPALQYVNLFKEILPLDQIFSDALKYAQTSGAGVNAISETLRVLMSRGITAADLRGKNAAQLTRAFTDLLTESLTRSGGGATGKGVMAQAGFVANMYIASMKDALDRKKALFKDMYGIDLPEADILSDLESQRNDIMKALDQMYGAVIPEGILKGTDAWSRAVGESFRDNKDVQTLQRRLMEINQILGDLPKTTPLPEWDRWLPIESDAAAFTKITEFWQGYVALVKDASTTIGKYVQETGIVATTPEQYSAYVKYAKSREDLEKDFAKLQDDILKAKYSSEEERTAALARLKQDYDTALYANEEKFKQEMYKRDMERMKTLADVAQRGNVAKYQEQFNKQIASGQFGQVAQGVAGQAISGTQMGAVAMGGDPLTIALAAIASFAMELENVMKILNPFTTILESMGESTVNLLDGMLSPMIKNLENMSVILGQVIQPFAMLAQTALSLIYAFNVINPTFLALKALASALDWLANKAIKPIGNFIIDTINSVIDQINKLIPLESNKIKRLERIGEHLASVDDMLKMKSELLGNTLSYLTNLIREEADRQKQSWQDLWEVGAITSTQYESEIKAINDNLSRMEEARYQIEADQLATLDSMLALWERLEQAKAAVDAGNNVDIGNIGGLTGGTTGGTGGSPIRPPYDGERRLGNPSAPTVPPHIQQYQDELKFNIDALAKADAIWSEQMSKPWYSRDAVKLAAAGLAGDIARANIKDFRERITAAGYTPAYAKGTASVPYDMNATIHKGEGIVPATFMDSVRRNEISIGGPGHSGGSGGNVTVVVNVAGSVKAEKDLARTVAEEIYKQRVRGHGVVA